MLINRKKLRRYYRFYGEVQAVGFRYKACRAAKDHGATGWVKNERDDSVSMEIQGSEKQIEDVLYALNNDIYIRIDRMETKELSPIRFELGFKVKY